MSDLDNLRPEVREAWRRMRYASELTKGTVMSSTADMELIFRDHLRLAGSLTDCHQAGCQMLHGGAVPRDVLREALEFIRALRNGTQDEAIDLLTNNAGEDVEARLEAAIAKESGR